MSEVNNLGEVPIEELVHVLKAQIAELVLRCAMLEALLVKERREGAP